MKKILAAAGLSLMMSTAAGAEQAHTRNAYLYIQNEETGQKHMIMSQKPLCTNSPTKNKEFYIGALKAFAKASVIPPLNSEQEQAIKESVLPDLAIKHIIDPNIESGCASKEFIPHFKNSGIHVTMQ